MRAPWAYPTAMTLLIGLSGCGAETPGSCKVATAADVPVFGHSFQPMVVGLFRGQRVVLMLDTGAAGSIVTPNAVASFGLSVDRDNIVGLSGVSGTKLAPSASIHGLMLGHGHVPDLDLPVGGGNLPDKVQGVPVLGLFGADFLSGYDVDFDLPHHHFGMYGLAGCGDAIQPVPPPYFTVPFRLDGSSIKVEVKVNDVPIEAQLDSGAGRTYITRADARRIGITDEMMANDRARTVHGVDEAAVKGRLHRFDSLEFGAERLRNFPFTVAPSNVGISLLGDEFFHLNRIWISYPRHMLFIQPVLSDPIFHMASNTPQAPGQP